MNSTIKSLLIALFFCIQTANAQHPFYWQQYGSFNPGAAGVGDTLSLSSSHYFSSDLFQNRTTVNSRIDKIHGGLSASYIGFYNDYLFRDNGLNLNYSFHARLGEECTLGIGVGMNYNNYRYQMSDGGYMHSNDYRGSFGMHFQSKRFRTGISFTPRLQSYDLYYQIGLTMLYADYNFRLGEKWDLQTGIVAAQEFAVFNLTAKCNNKLWFGGNFGFENVDVFFGMNLNRGLSLGAGVGQTARYSLYPEYYGSVFLKAKLFELFGGKE